MSITIHTNGAISIDGQDTGLGVSQATAGTQVYTREGATRAYKLHTMPHARYSTAHDAPASGAAGRGQLEADVRALVATL